MGRVKTADDEEPAPPSAPVSCPPGQPAAKRRNTITGPRVTPKPLKKVTVKREIAAEPSTGRYATLPESREDVVVPRRRAPKMKMKSSPKPSVPTVLTTDLGDANIEPRDAFILSRIDGVLTIDEIADMTGLDGADVRESLARMAKLRIVKL
jgi:hypothetical protein